MKHLVTLKDWSPDEIRECLDLALDVKQNAAAHSARMRRRILAMLFQKTSTRTRASFAAAMLQLGGSFYELDWASSNFSIAGVGDEARCLSRYSDVIMARLLRHEDLVEMARASEVPVINGCCNKYHPCQILADLTTIYSRTRDLSSVHLVYVGVWNNVANSLLAGGLRLGMQITFVTPVIQESSADPELRQLAESSPQFTLSDDFDAAIRDADFLYTDTWVDMEFFQNEAFAEQKKQRIEQMMPYQLDARVLDRSRGLVMHCLPAHRGYEISGDVLEHPRCIAVEQAENRMHAQKAALVVCRDA